ncbi:transposase [Streptomyces guryensis]|uniref:transposase n=1 Tax=Streptomyces guryensis TaxID=2886947 RepID=UPI003556B3BD
MNKVDKAMTSAAEAVAGIPEGAPAVGGFGLCGIPTVLIRHLRAQGALLMRCADCDIPEVRTVDRWWPEIQAFIATGHGNAKSEGINLMIKLAAQAAHGFRNPTNQRLHTRCVTTRRARGRLHPAPKFEDSAHLAAGIFRSRPGGKVCVWEWLRRSSPCADGMHRRGARIAARCLIRRRRCCSTRRCRSSASTASAQRWSR